MKGINVQLVCAAGRKNCGVAGSVTRLDSGSNRCYASLLLEIAAILAAVTRYTPIWSCKYSILVQRFISKFKLSRLEQEFVLVRKVSTNLATISPQYLLAALDLLDELDYNKEPPSITDINQVTRFWGAVDIMCTYSDTSYVWCNICRLHTMYSEYYAVGHMRELGKLVRDIAAKPHDELPSRTDWDPWTRLVVKVRTQLQTNSSFKIHSRDYHVLPDRIYTFGDASKRKRQRLYMTETQELVDATVDLVTQILREWFNIPQNF